MKILALDLATKTGWAFWRHGWSKPESGVQEFSLQRGESPGMRFLRFRKWLQNVGESIGPDLYVYEQAHHRGGAATELCVGFTTRVQEEAAARGAQHIGVHTATLKKFATGNGRAGKEDMIRTAREKWGIEPIDDNHADALMLLAYAWTQYE